MTWEEQKSDGSLVFSQRKTRRPKYSLILHEIQQPVTQFITKFGGQPTWLTTPQWPLSRSTGIPMRFIGQIALDPEIFGNIAGRMAYLFLTDDEEIFVDNTFDPEGGENAVIIQPSICEIPTQALTTGPTLYKMVNASSSVTLVPVPCEFTVEVSPGEDPDVIVEDEQAHATDEAWKAFTALWEEIKIGGAPAFV